MKQENPFRYVVEPGERITIRITPMKGAAGQRVIALLGRTELVNKGADESPKFDFTSTVEDDFRHRVMLTFSFVNADPDDAHYTISIGGSAGGEFEGRTVWKENGLTQEPKYRFKVEEEE